MHGAYHFALPDSSDGATQADYFVDHGGGWSADGRTLPGTLDIEYNPYGPTCYGLGQSAMVTWIGQFRSEYLARTGRYPAIYAGFNWWTECTGGYAGFGADPLWTAHYAATVGTLPAGWTGYTIWQYADYGVFPATRTSSPETPRTCGPSPPVTPRCPARTAGRCWRRARAAGR